MSSIRFTSFGAATMPLSKIVVDKDLEMGPYAIKGVYRPEEWATETLEWGDTPESVQTLAQDSLASSNPVVMFTAVAGSKLTKWVLNFTTRGPAPYTSPSKIQILVDGVEILHTDNLSSTSHELVFYPPTGASIVVNHISGGSYSAAIEAGATLKDTGLVVGPKTFDLSGKWLALGLDMKGLAATVKIQGVQIPYSDYAKYFPIAPTELTIPGQWDMSQERPVIKVYKWR